TLPTNVTMSSDGLVSGTPGNAGLFTISARADDGAGNSVTGTVSLSVNTPWATTFPEGGSINTGAFVDPPNTVFAGLAARGLYVTTNGGGLWRSLTDQTPPAFDRYNVMVYTQGAGSTAYVISGGRPGQTTNGTTWTLSDAGLPVTNGWTVESLAADPGNGHLFAGTYANGIHKSLDGGATWTVSMPGSAEFRSMAIAPSTHVVFAGSATSGL